MEIVIVNQTRVSTAKLERIIRFVSPKNIIIPKIRVRRVSSLSFYAAFYYPKKSPRRIYASVGTYDHFPTFIVRNSERQREGYLSNFWIHSQEEALVYLLAHETRHSFQDQHPDAPRLGKRLTRRKFSETDADTYALLKLDEWRRSKKKFKNVN